MNKIKEIEKEEELILKERQIWRYATQYYILGRVNDDEYVLISLNDGNRWTNPSKIEDVFGQSKDEFELVTNPITITPE